jgi:hypothetical protein
MELLYSKYDHVWVSLHCGKRNGRSRAPLVVCNRSGTVHAMTSWRCTAYMPWRHSQLTPPTSLRGQTANMRLCPWPNHKPPACASSCTLTFSPLPGADDLKVPFANKSDTARPTVVKTSQFLARSHTWPLPLACSSRNYTSMLTEVFPAHLLYSTRHQTVRSPTSVAWEAERKQTLINMHSKSIADRATEHCRWERMFIACTVCASLSAALPTPLIPLLTVMVLPYWLDQQDLAV